MPKPRGSKKTGGRKAGTPNKTTNKVKQSLQEFFENNWDGIQDHYDSLPPKDKLLWMKELMPYLAPKQSSNDNKIRFEDMSDEMLDALVNKITSKANGDLSEDDE